MRQKTRVQTVCLLHGSGEFGIWHTTHTTQKHRYTLITCNRTLFISVSTDCLWQRTRVHSHTRRVHTHHIIYTHLPAQPVLRDRCCVLRAYYTFNAHLKACARTSTMINPHNNTHTHTHDLCMHEDAVAAQAHHSVFFYCMLSGICSMLLRRRRRCLQTRSVHY